MDCTAFLLTCIWQLKHNKIPVATIEWEQLWYCHVINWVPETIDNDAQWENVRWLLINLPIADATRLCTTLCLLLSLAVNHMLVARKQIKIQKKNVKCLCFVQFLFYFLVFIEFVICYLVFEFTVKFIGFATEIQTINYYFLTFHFRLVSAGK